MGPFEGISKNSSKPLYPSEIPWPMHIRRNISEKLGGILSWVPFRIIYEVHIIILIQGMFSVYPNVLSTLKQLRFLHAIKSQSQAGTGTGITLPWNCLNNVYVIRNKLVLTPLA